jgi:hypothetical protein
LSGCQSSQALLIPVSGGDINEEVQGSGEVIAVRGAYRRAGPVGYETPAPVIPLLPSNPYEGLTVDNLAGRPYGGGQFEIVKPLADEGAFVRYLIRYPSDGLTIYGFMDVPTHGQPPYPVIIAIHGLVDVQRYQTLDYTTVYADILARAGSW